MCRWAAWTGEPVLLEHLVSRPAHSLIDQSRAATECKMAVNADGFGLAWYGEHEAPGLYRDVYPAWSDANLQSMIRQVRSHHFLAHVRASTGTATSRNNCHPFVSGRWSFMHNGQIGGFEHFRRQADMMIADEHYGHRRGATDSEALFLIALARGLDADPCGALWRATSELEALSRSHGAAPHVRMAAALSDGKRLIAVRYATDAHAPTLYHRWDDENGGRIVASEPLDDKQGWLPLAPGRICIFEGESLLDLPFAADISAAA